MTVQATGHHTGTHFELPGRPPVAPSGRRVRLQPELMKVRVEGGRIQEIVVSCGGQLGLQGNAHVRARSILSCLIAGAPKRGCGAGCSVRSSGG